MKSPLADAMQRLAALLGEENAALGAMNFSLAGALLAAKHAAADALAAACRAADATPAPAEALHELSELAEHNKALLNRAMRVQLRVLDLVARAAKAAQPPGTYGAAGRPKADKPAPQSLHTRA